MVTKEEIFCPLYLICLKSNELYKKVFFFISGYFTTNAVAFFITHCYLFGKLSKHFCKSENTTTYSENKSDLPISHFVLHFYKVRCCLID